MNKLLNFFLFTCSLKAMVAMDEHNEGSQVNRVVEMQSSRHEERFSPSMRVSAVELVELQSLHPMLNILGTNNEIDLDLIPQIIGFLQEFTLSQKQSPLFAAIRAPLELKRQIEILGNFVLNNTLILEQLDLKYSGRNYEKELIKFITDSLKVIES